MAAVEIKVPEDYTRDPIWLKIRGLELDDETSQLTFSERLARENRWAHWFALEVIDEYKKFLYLMARAGHPVTPSIQVDQAWHLHLIYTRLYWDDFAKDMPFEPHHDPSKGSMAESEKLTDWYSNTLKSYQRIFGMDPPVNIWPDPKERFREDQAWQWLDMSQHIILDQKMGYLGLLIVFLLFLVLSWLRPI